MISLQDIIAAHEKMKGIVHMTPLDYSSTFSELSHNEVYLKLENLQKTGSFKVRGSYNKMVSLEKGELENGVIAASAGNHAQGVAYSSNMLGIPCTIVMPKGAPLSKVLATKRYGAHVELQGDAFDDALAYALDLKEQTGAKFVHPFDDEAVIAGQGTVGLEIMQQLDDIDAVICPVGGGGLIAGIAMAIKEQKPSVKIYGVQALACPGMKQSFEEKKVITVESSPTMADGIAVKRPGELTFQLVERYVDDIFCVDEMEIARTMLMLLERNKLLVEGSGASSLAALLYQKVPVKEKKVVSVLSGGNVDVNFITRIIEHGMVEAGRFVHIATTIKDKPGHLQHLLEIVTRFEANVLYIHLERIGTKVFPGYAQLHLSLETKDKNHIEEVLSAIEKEGYNVEVID
ncbi:threonine ammonia-lyase [Bacillus pseudomycoides]|uniref:threonine ammonia-lyase n=1 Tax=Bacillus pseudomycoides TaxID=64104 RepID=UPI000BECE0AD|nr:threonine ammonia-lyase [Bacillus pseudomycoides]PEE44383.1 threonine ammonia-lyase [Bacillus pseudomycoides]PGA92309.1 threonine ammonia-lyase [Bacillus pseudomycoides]